MNAKFIDNTFTESYLNNLIKTHIQYYIIDLLVTNGIMILKTIIKYVLIKMISNKSYMKINIKNLNKNLLI